MLKNSIKIFLAGGAMIASGAASSITINESFEGQWFRTDVSARQGFEIEYVKQGPERGTVFMTGYLFDDNGEQFWVFGQDEVLDGESVAEINLRTITGGAFTEASPNTTTEDFGTLRLEANNCRSINFEVTDISSDRVTADSVSFELNPLDEIGGTQRDASICVFQNSFTGCPSFATTGPIEKSCQLTGTLTGDLTLTNNTTWVLNGGVFVGGDNVSQSNLTIEPGTRIVGTTGNDFLAIQRGSKIFAEGTAESPIVFTGPFNASDDQAGPGNWGGLVINGNAPINICDDSVSFADCEAVGEGGAGNYGGDQPNDSSGVLKYVRVQFGGFKINDLDELNGIAFQGVGDGTVVDYIQVHANEDDGIEFFGGTVNAKHVVLTDIRDDSLDWTQGWNGSIQYVLIKQNQNESIDKDRGFEADNYDAGNDNSPRSQPQIANATLIGAAADGKDTIGIILKEGTGANITNSIITGFESCLDIDGAPTFTAAGSPDNLTGGLTITNTIVDCDVDFQEDDGEAFTVEAFFDAQSGNVSQTVNLNNFVPVDNSVRGFNINPALWGDFFDKVDYAGAFDKQSTAWTNGWTEFLD